MSSPVLSASGDGWPSDSLSVGSSASGSKMSALQAKAVAAAAKVEADIKAKAAAKEAKAAAVNQKKADAAAAKAAEKAAKVAAKAAEKAAKEAAAASEPKRGRGRPRKDGLPPGSKSTSIVSAAEARAAPSLLPPGEDGEIAALRAQIAELRMHVTALQSAAAKVDAIRALLV